MIRRRTDFQLLADFFNALPAAQQRRRLTQLSSGQSIEEVCKKLEVRPPTYHRWRQEYGGAKEETVKRLKELEKENGRLKRLVADLSLDKAILKEIAEGKW